MLKKKILIISLAVLMCAALFNLVPMICGNQNKVVATESSFGSFENDYNVSSSGDGSKVSINNNTLTIGTGSTSDGRVSTIATSKSPVDFTRNFTLTGKLTDTTTPDGFTITFQPNKDYNFNNSYKNTGTSLCVYRDEDAINYAANSLITEVDTYDSNSIGPHNGTNNRTDQSDLTDKIKNHDTIGENGSRVPHLAISTLDSEGTEKLQDASLITAGDDGQDGTVGIHKMTIKWEVTDSDKGTGIYTVTYDDKKISCQDFDPLKTFGTTSPYLTFTGSISFSSLAQSGNAWAFEIGSFQYNDPAKLTVSETSDNTSKYVFGNQKIKYTIKIKNTGGDAVGVRVRRYMPDYTKFYSVDSSGEYGCIDQREHATWFIKSIPKNSSVTLSYTIVVDVCHPDNYQIPHKVYYEVTKNTTAPYTNTAQDPKEVAGNQ